MAYWITLKKAEVRRGFSAVSPQEALAVLEAKRLEGYEEVRIIDPNGNVTDAYALSMAIEDAKGRDLSVPSAPEEALADDATTQDANASRGS